MLRIFQQQPTSSVKGDEIVHVPLKSVHVEANIRSFAADVRITQIFRNDEQNSIEAVYCFPIEEHAAIYSFQAQIDDREIVAQLKEKKEAQQEYNKALQQGHGAYLLEQDEKCQDNFIINIGALPPLKECRITIAYVTELEFFQGSTIRFVIPTVIAPRYNPDKSSISAPANTTSKYVQSSPYTIDFHCHIDKMEQYIARINSPSHPIQVDFAQQDAYIVTFAQENTHLDHDILINIELSTKRANTIVAVESGAVMGVFTPTEEDCRQESNIDQINEFIFVIDCSGSMQDENKIGLARQAMLLFLKSLPLDCHFNIIRFGSEYKTLFTDITTIYNEDNARIAEKLINEIQADLGGTELMRPLQWIEQHLPSEGRARQIFLLTDGEISNVTEVLDLCRSMATSTRIFSFGLGHSPSRSLVKGLARSTNGRFVFIPPNANVDIYVGEQLQKALQSCITNVDVQWNLGIQVENAPRKIPPVYANDRLIVYALSNDKTIPFDQNSSVELRTISNHRSLGISKVDRIPNIDENQTIARLAAKALILELQHDKDSSFNGKKSNIGSLQTQFQQLNTTTEETTQVISDKQTNKERIIELSLKYNILSPHTAFIGVEKRTNTTNDQMVLREVPIEISADDQHLYRRRRRSPRSLASTRSKLFTLSRRKGSTLSSAYNPTAINSANYSSLLMCDDVKDELCSAMPMATINCLKSASASINLQMNSSDTTKPEDDSELELELERLANDAISVPQSSKKDELLLELETWANGAISVPQFPKKDDVWPSNDEDIVRYLINKQNFDGLWNSDSTIIQRLTGKPLSTFQSINTEIDASILTSLIIILIIETRFSTYSSLWHGVMQKARKRINTLLNNDSANLETLFENIRQQL